jgi:hypothetical protein
MGHIAFADITHKHNVPDTGTHNYPKALLLGRTAGCIAKISLASAHNSASSFVWHSQIVRTCHPRAFNLSVASASRALLAMNFAFQKPVRVAGVVAYLHPGC